MRCVCVYLKIYHVWHLCQWFAMIWKKRFNIEISVTFYIIKKKYITVKKISILGIYSLKWRDFRLTRMKLRYKEQKFVQYWVFIVLLKSLTRNLMHQCCCIKRAACCISKRRRSPRPNRTKFTVSNISIVESNFIGSHKARQALTLILDLHEANEGSEYKAREFLDVTYWRIITHLLKTIGK